MTPVTVPLIVLIALIPPAYLASFRYFVIIPDRKKDSYLLRFVCLFFPMITLWSIECFFSAVVCDLIINAFCGRDEFFSEAGLLIAAVFCSVSVSVIFRICFISEKMPPELNQDFMNHEYYVYYPCRPSMSGKPRTRYMIPKRKPADLMDYE